MDEAEILLRCDQPMRAAVQVIGVLLLSGTVVACFKGGERDKDPPPGLPGGQCLAPDGTCDEGVCNRMRNYCYDPADPCRGFFCGGQERGNCSPSDGQPECTCVPPYNNEQFDLYCCPGEGTAFDARCQEAPGGSSGSGGE